MSRWLSNISLFRAYYKAFNNTSRVPNYNFETIGAVTKRFLHRVLHPNIRVVQMPPRTSSEEPQTSCAARRVGLQFQPILSCYGTANRCFSFKCFETRSEIWQTFRSSHNILWFHFYHLFFVLVFISQRPTSTLLPLLHYLSCIFYFSVEYVWQDNNLISRKIIGFSKKLSGLISR